MPPLATRKLGLAGLSSCATASPGEPPRGGWRLGPGDAAASQRHAGPSNHAGTVRGTEDAPPLVRPTDISNDRGDEERPSPGTGTEAAPAVTGPRRHEVGGLPRITGPRGEARRSPGPGTDAALALGGPMSNEVRGLPGLGGPRRDEGELEREIEIGQARKGTCKGSATNASGAGPGQAKARAGGRILGATK